MERTISLSQGKPRGSWRGTGWFERGTIVGALCVSLLIAAAGGAVAGSLDTTSPTEGIFAAPLEKGGIAGNPRDELGRRAAAGPLPGTANLLPAQPSGDAPAAAGMHGQNMASETG